MTINRNNNYSNNKQNIHNFHNNIIFDNFGTYLGRKDKVFKYCEKCGKELVEGSDMAFCDWECMSSFYEENAREINSVVREIMGRN